MTTLDHSGGEDIPKYVTDVVPIMEHKSSRFRVVDGADMTTTSWTSGQSLARNVIQSAVLRNPRWFMVPVFRMCKPLDPLHRVNFQYVSVKSSDENNQRGCVSFARLTFGRDARAGGFPPWPQETKDAALCGAPPNAEHILSRSVFPCMISSESCFEHSLNHSFPMSRFNRSTMTGPGIANLVQAIGRPKNSDGPLAPPPHNVWFALCDCVTVKPHSTPCCSVNCRVKPPNRPPRSGAGLVPARSPYHACSRPLRSSPQPTSRLQRSDIPAVVRFGIPWNTARLRPCLLAR